MGVKSLREATSEMLESKKNEMPLNVYNRAKHVIDEIDRVAKAQDAMKKGDLFVVKKGLNHRVSSVEECSIMLIESKTTEHTGKVKSKITKSIEEQTY